MRSRKLIREFRFQTDPLPMGGEISEFPFLGYDADMPVDTAHNEFQFQIERLAMRFTHSVNQESKPHLSLLDDSCAEGPAPLAEEVRRGLLRR